jgi:hypothetical protein
MNPSLRWLFPLLAITGACAAEAPPTVAPPAPTVAASSPAGAPGGGAPAQGGGHVGAVCGTDTVNGNGYPAPPGGFVTCDAGLECCRGCGGAPGPHFCRAACDPCSGPPRP